MELNELILDVFTLECKLFMKMDSFHLIKQKCDGKCLNQQERKQLNTDIQYAIKRMIKTIKELCSDFTDEDIVFCCLIKSGLDKMIVSRCIGSPGKEAVNQRKYRIKKKMKDAECENLFDVIFKGTKI
jgi:pyridoxine 5'-phosphate synthase PdxJ